MTVHLILDNYISCAMHLHLKFYKNSKVAPPIDTQNSMNSIAE